MTKITWKPGTLLAPVPPALISCGTMEKPNVMTAAWTGIISSDPVITYVSIRPGRYSHDIIKESGEFVINLPNLPLARATDFCGIKSGRDIDKFKEAGLTAAPCSEIKAPQVLESPLSIECKVKSIVNYGTHDMFVAEVAAVNVDDKYIDEDGKLWLEKAGLLAYVHGFYYTLGRNLGKFGFSVEKKPKKTPQNDFTVKEESVENKSEAKSERRSPARPERRFSRDGRKPFNEAPREKRNFDDKPRDRRNFDDKPREKRAFDDRKPKRFSDDRRHGLDDRAPRRDNGYNKDRRNFEDRKPRSDNREGSSGRDERNFEDRKTSRGNYNGSKKFDGKAKFEKARRTDRERDYSAVPQKRVNRPKRV